MAEKQKYQTIYASLNSSQSTIVYVPTFWHGKEQSNITEFELGNLHILWRKCRYCRWEMSVSK